MYIKNKKGQIGIFFFMLGVAIMILALALAPAISQTIDESRDDPLLNCSSDSISTEKKSVCTSLDAMKPYFIGIMLGLAVIVTWKIT